jgi:hypothetical protein
MVGIHIFSKNIDQFYFVFSDVICYDAKNIFNNFFFLSLLVSQNVRPALVMLVFYSG